VWWHRPVIPGFERLRQVLGPPWLGPGLRLKKKKKSFLIGTSKMTIWQATARKTKTNKNNKKPKQKNP
jgi:hypothetical protein